MKKISTLAFMAFFFCLSAMAQVELGDIHFSLGAGKKVNPNNGKITVTFPNVTGIGDPTTTYFVLEGSFGNEDTAFDGVESSFAEGATFELQDFGLEPATNYVLTITSVKVDGVECAAEGGYTLPFATRGAERKMAWDFTIDEDTKAKIVADDKNDPEAEGTYWKCIAADQRHYIHQSLNDSEIMLDADNVLPCTEDLTFTAGTDKMFIGDTSGSFVGMLVFNAGNLRMTIPDCKEGDVITFNGVNATKGSESKQTCIQALYGGAIAPEGEESSTGLVDSLWVAADGNYKFKVVADGDVSFNFSNFRMRTITIEEGVVEVPCTYNVVAAYTADGNTTVLKELVGKTEGMSGSSVKTLYPYWLADADGNVYTHGTKGSPMEETLELKGDTTFTINYAKTAMEGAVYLSEGEDIPGAVEVTHANSAIRSSMGKAGYVLEDTKLVTLEPGTYKIRAIIFDGAKTASHVVTLTKGEGEENEIYLSATATNWTEAESDLLTITEATDITLKAGGGDDKGLDVIVIYASTDAPDDPDEPDAIVEVKDAQKAAVRKVLKNGQILFETQAGTFNTAGVQVK